MSEKETRGGSGTAVTQGGVLAHEAAASAPDARRRARVALPKAPPARSPGTMHRREVLRLLGLAPVAALFGCGADVAERAVQELERLERGAAPIFFEADEWDTVRILADLIIPADDRSGSATDALVPEFIDFMLNEGSEGRRRTIREGLTWLESECERRYGLGFLACDDAQRAAVLDDIAWPDRAPAGMEDGVAFFNTFRDMTAAGFFSSRMGYEDLDYRGGEFVVEWHGCPEPALRKLGVNYDLMGERSWA